MYSGLGTLQVGDDLPDGAQQTGVLNGVAVYSTMVFRKENDGVQVQRFGFYVAGDAVGYYVWYRVIHTPTVMYILVHV